MEDEMWEGDKSFHLITTKFIFDHCLAVSLFLSIVRDFFKVV